jgi:ribonuclease BN (tRNA processing enzyme)
VSLSVTVLGSSGMFATRDRASSGYLIRTEGLDLWLDAGGGTWRHLLEEIDFPSLTGIMLSHRHPDHTIDLFQALHARMHGSAEPMPPIPLWANGETLERVAAYASEVDVSFELREIRSGEDVEVQSLKFSFHDMHHWCDTLGIRIEGPEGVVAYTADTGAEADLAPLARDADLFLCEATKQDADEVSEGHLRASQAGEIAAQNGVGRLVLTHLPPGRDLGLSLTEAHRTCGGIPVELAADLKTYEVGA